MKIGGIFVKITIIETRTVPTIKAELNGRKTFFHSKYNPLIEAQAWYERESKFLKTDEGIIVIGLGAGYHIQQLAENLPEQEITIIEFNDTFFNWFKNSPFHKRIRHYKNVKIQQFSALSTTEKKQVFSSVSSTNLLVHKTGLDLLPQEYNGIRGILEDIQIQKSSILNQIENMNDNFKKNILLNDLGIGTLQNVYEGKPMILVSAGPSLDKQLPLLKKIRDEHFFIIGAVGTAIKPLISFDIVPDFFALIDPNPVTYNQLTGVNLTETTLFYLSTAYHDTIMLHKGPRRIVYQGGYENAEKLANEKNDPTIQTGGSVATALLDIMVYLGGQSIALIGQDLAYTDGKSHASAAHAQKEISDMQGAKKVLNYDQTGEVQTGTNLTIYRNWFEQYAKNNKNLRLYNCTEGGAYINNWMHITLTDYYLKYG